MLSLTTPTPDPTVGQPPTLPPPAPAQAAVPTATVPVLPNSAAVGDAWVSAAVGLERRVYNVGGMVDLFVVRIDPAYYTFRAHYRPDDPLYLSGWQAALPDAAAFINANFFNHDYTVLGLLIADSVPYGAAFTQRGGMFAVEEGVPRIRVNTLEPYSAGEAVEQAVSAYPMLVIDGAAVYNNPNDRDVARRSAVAIDSVGRVLFIVTPLAGISLNEFSAYLPTTDMGVVRALNLDGGGSTLLHIAATEQELRSFDSVPAVLAVYPR